MYILFIHLFVDGNLYYIHLLAIVNNAAININVQITVSVSAFNPFGYIPISEITGSYVNSIFNFLGHFLFIIRLDSVLIQFFQKRPAIGRG